jgi:hypothetical protein
MLLLYTFNLKDFEAILFISFFLFIPRPFSDNQVAARLLSHFRAVSARLKPLDSNGPGKEIAVGFHAH